MLSRAMTSPRFPYDLRFSNDLIKMNFPRLRLLPLFLLLPGSSLPIQVGIIGTRIKNNRGNLQKVIPDELCDIKAFAGESSSIRQVFRYFGFKSIVIDLSHLARYLQHLLT